MTTAEPSMELALSGFRGEVLVQLATIVGQLELLKASGAAAERRSDEQAQRSIERADRQDTAIKHLDERVDVIETTGVTRSDLDERSRRTITILGLIVGVLSIVSGAGTSVIIAVINK